MDYPNYICPRCGMLGCPSIHGDYCTGCANHFRLGNLDPLQFANKIQPERESIVTK